jgi:hypothetical protein
MTPLVDCGPEAQLLVAASVSWKQLGKLLDSVVGTILQASEQKKPPIGPIKRKKFPTQSKEDAQAGLLTILDGIQTLSEVVTKQEGWRPFAMSSNEGRLHEFGTSNWAPEDPIEHSLAARALGTDWELIRLSLRRLPREDVLHRRLCSGLRLATKGVRTPPKKVVGYGDSIASAHCAHRQAVAELRSLASIPGSEPGVDTWIAATCRVHSTGLALRNIRWDGGEGHGANQLLRLQMFKHEAVVRQYALLMEGCGRRYRAVVLLGAVALLFGAGKRYATQLIGRLPEGHQSRVSSLFDVDIVEPAVRSRWANELGCSRTRAERLIRTVVGAGQNKPWTLQEHFAQFVKKGLVGGAHVPSQKRCVVDEILAPMQAVGLAAQLPWREVLKVESSKRDERVSLSTWRGRAWVVNPYGAHLSGK